MLTNDTQDKQRSVNEGLDTNTDSRPPELGGVPVHYANKYERSVNEGLFDDSNVINKIRREFNNIKI